MGVAVAVAAAIPAFALAAGQPPLPDWLQQMIDQAPPAMQQHMRSPEMQQMMRSPEMQQMMRSPEMQEMMRSSEESSGMKRALRAPEAP